MPATFETKIRARASLSPPDELAIYHRTDHDADRSGHDQVARFGQLLSGLISSLNATSPSMQWDGFENISTPSVPSHVELHRRPDILCDALLGDVPPARAVQAPAALVVLESHRHDDPLLAKVGHTALDLP